MGIAPSFVHLHNHSHYSLLDGLTRIGEMVDVAKRDGQPAVALTDHGALYGAVEFYQAATKAGIKPIIGVEAYYAPDGRLKKTQAGEKRTNHLILLAKNNVGYQNLLTLISAANLEGFYYKPRIDWEILDRYGEGLIVLTACLGGELSQAILHGKPGDDEAVVRRFQRRFGEDYFLEVHHRSNTPEQLQVNARMFELSAALGVPTVATNDCHYLRAEDADAQDVLLCLQTKAKQDDVGRLCMMDENYSFRKAKEMRLAFEDHPEACDATLAIAERCNVTLELGKIHLPSYPIPKGTTYDGELLALCDRGFARRYDAASSTRQGEARERMAYELRVISEMGYSSYFLIVADFVNWAKEQGIVVGPGRGSAAGSIVAYLCNITNLDPLSYDLLFERFLAPGRIQMPDIDLDFADHRRDEVLAYVRQKYGEDHVAQIITFGTMAARASLRDVGRVLDVPYTFCDRLAKLVPLGATLDEAERKEPELKQLVSTDETTRRLVAIAKRLEGAARHTSTHACGVVISAKPLTEHLPIQYASADDATIVTQYGMHAVEDLGLLKMDFLGLSNLSIIEHTVNLIHARGEAIDIEQLVLDDAAAYQLLQRGETTGVFQLESGGMKRYLKDLKPSEFEDIIAMVALYRPGPMELIPEYIDRKFNRKPVTYIHPKLEPILKNTYGIMVYQEQLMRLARDLAGFSLTEADVLRKAVGKKIKKLLDEQRDKLVDGMIAHSIDAAIAKNIWAWIEPFARYGFNRSHAACYALIAYQTAYLKAHYPAEFMCALLTSERSDTDRLAVLIQECREMDIEVLGPDVNTSDAVFIPEARDGGLAIRFGLAGVKNVGEHIVETLVAERRARGTFVDLEDMLTRVQDKDFNKKSLESLIRAGAFDRFGERGQLLENLDRMLAFNREAVRDAMTGQENLFGSVVTRVALELRAADPIPQRLLLGWEKELLGLYLSAHPFAASAEVFGGAIATIAACKDARTGDGSEVFFGGVITRTKRIVTKKGDPMLFGEVEDHTASVEVVVFPRVLEASPQTWMDGTTVLVRGKRSDKDGTPKILADRAVQVLPGRERDALEQFGVHSGGDAAQRMLLLDLPPAFPQERLAALRTLLQQFPGTVPVRLRSAAGHLISTGIAVALTGDLRDALEAQLGAAAVHDEVLMTAG
ncbi:MAG: DNA polymerase III subunit alpha [bacterium]|nr:DNA polymerase III subunit alpha [bacterium]